MRQTAEIVLLYSVLLIIGFPAVSLRVLSEPFRRFVNCLALEFELCLKEHTTVPN